MAKKKDRTGLIRRAYKYRIYPSVEQIEFSLKSFGCCRKIWNLMLDDKMMYFKETGKMLNTTPAQYKDVYPYLREVDSLALANVQLNLQNAYKRFFEDKSVGFPEFKSKKNCRNSYTTNNQNCTIKLLDGYIKLPKIGSVKAKIHRLPKEGGVLKSATISMEKDGTFYCSLLYEYDAAPVNHIPDTDKAVGLDYQSEGLYVASDESMGEGHKYYKESQEKLAKLQRQFRNKIGNEKGSIKSKNYKKLMKKIAKLHRHIANQRKDYLHKKSTEIANLYDIVCAEDLNMRALANKGFGNGKSTLDNGYGMFLTFLEYKLQYRGKVFIKVDKFYPSSQLCSCCGHKNPELKDLSIRKWTCPSCGTHHDRDINAAKNILNEGLRIYHAA